MERISRYILTLAMLLTAASGAWAELVPSGTVYNSAVAFSDLKLGDVLTSGFSITGLDETHVLNVNDCKCEECAVVYAGGADIELGYEVQFLGGLAIKNAGEENYTPWVGTYDDGHELNAWIVASVDDNAISLIGYDYVPVIELTTLEDDPDGFGWKFTMPNFAVMVDMLYEADFAWVRNENDSVKNTVLTGYAGFEFTPQPTLKMRYSDQNDEFKKLITYESSNKEVALVNDTTGVVSLMGAGTAQINAIFAGNDVYADTTVSYTINVQKPDTLFLVANPAGGAVFTVTGKAQVPGSEEYKGIKYVGSDKYIVIPDTTVFIAATAAPGYHLNVTDPTKLKEGEYRDTLTMGSTDRTVTVTLEENTYDLALSAQNSHHIADGKATVRLDNVDKTANLTHNTDGSVSRLAGVKFSHEVKLNAATGYKFRKVEVKKLAEPTVTAPTAKAITTTSNGSETIVTGGAATGGTMKYALSTNTTQPDNYSNTVPTVENLAEFMGGSLAAGTYYVWYKVFGDPGYSDSEAAYVEVTVTDN